MCDNKTTTKDKQFRFKGFPGKPIKGDNKRTSVFKDGKIALGMKKSPKRSYFECLRSD